MRVRRAPDVDAPRAVRRDAYPGPVSRRNARKVLAEPPGELFDRSRAEPPREGVYGVLLRISGQHLLVVAGQMGIAQVAGEGDADVQVGDLVPARAPVHVEQPHLRLPVLGRPKRDALPGLTGGGHAI